MCSHLNFTVKLAFIPDLKDGASQAHPADEAHFLVLGATRVRLNLVGMRLSRHLTIWPALKKVIELVIAVLYCKVQGKMTMSIGSQPRLLNIEKRLCRQAEKVKKEKCKNRLNLAIFGRFLEGYFILAIFGR